MPNPLKTFVAVTWNCGSLSARMSHVVEILAGEQPHVCCLQEAKCKDHEFRGFLCRIRSLGYTANRCSRTNLVTVWRRGLNLVPIKEPTELTPFRVKNYALALGNNRFLLRNVHATADSSTNRNNLLGALAASTPASLTIEIGDFNCVPPNAACKSACMPEDYTFRCNGNDVNWQSTIDGALVGDCIAKNTKSLVLAVIPGAQHRPVRITINAAPLLS